MLIRDYDTSRSGPDWERFTRRLEQLNSIAATRNWEVISPKDIISRLDQMRMGLEAQGIHRDSLIGALVMFDIPYGNGKTMRTTAVRENEGWRITGLELIEGYGDRPRIDLTPGQAAMIATEAVKRYRVRGKELTQGRLIPAFTDLFDTISKGPS